jgi:hypothetical protein
MMLVHMKTKEIYGIKEETIIDCVILVLSFALAAAITYSAVTAIASDDVSIITLLLVLALFVALAPLCFLAWIWLFRFRKHVNRKGHYAKARVVKTEPNFLNARYSSHLLVVLLDEPGEKEKMAGGIFRSSFLIDYPPRSTIRVYINDDGGVLVCQKQN